MFRRVYLVSFIGSKSSSDSSSSSSSDDESNKMTVLEDLEKIMKDFNKQKKVIGLSCISPILAAKVFGKDGVKITLGG